MDEDAIGKQCIAREMPPSPTSMTKIARDIAAAAIARDLAGIVVPNIGDRLLVA